MLFLRSVSFSWVHFLTSHAGSFRGCADCVKHLTREFNILLQLAVEPFQGLRAAVTLLAWCAVQIQLFGLES